VIGVGKYLLIRGKCLYLQTHNIASDGDLVPLKMRRVLRRKGYSLVAFSSAIFLIWLLRLQFLGGEGSRLDFVDSAIHFASERFDAFHSDGTGGWSTKWFGRHTSPISPATLFNIPSRCPIYTYFDDSTVERNSDDRKVVEAWKRAFWSLGFQPIVLTERDARENSHYASFRSLVGSAQSSSVANYGKWFAMAQVGGLFVDYRVYLS
jgi:hypothetical protein